MGGGSDHPGRATAKSSPEPADHWIHRPNDETLSALARGSADRLPTANPTSRAARSGRAPAGPSGDRKGITECGRSRALSQGPWA
ncbi:MAG: hypothetical protein CL908_04590 [Deltaproteobacteria bacterium]|nr:hypothetical protein [Deltaproteobacteria bacterium]